ncbi:hypothetical protein MN0502_29760 [Arthrobacter sp. MN05-02]|nr:hypothetical protein MN0502_29760 [Arthrobacter sp. MN05-02]
MTAQTVGTSDGTPRPLDEPASVRFTPAGTPLALRWRGSIWQVVGEPVPWRASADRSVAASPAPGADGATPRSWRFRAQTGPASPVLDFAIGLDDRRGEWRLLRVGSVGS